MACNEKGNDLSGETERFQVQLVVKNPPVNARDSRDTGLIPGLGRSPGVRIDIRSSILAWETLRTEQPGRLQSMGLQRIGCD